MGPLGWPETVFIVILALLLFGPKKLPELGRTLGKAITEFKRASSELRSTFDREMRNLERETEVLKENVGSHFSDSYNYDYSSYDTGTPAVTEPSVVAETEPASPFSDSTMHQGASATEGAPSSTAASSRPGLTVTPAPDAIANGTLHNDPPVSAEAAQDTIKS